MDERKAPPHIAASHGHPFAKAQVSSSTDPTKWSTRSFTPTVRPAQGSLGDRRTASRHACPTRPSSARVIGSSSGSTSPPKKKAKKARSLSGGREAKSRHRSPKTYSPTHDRRRSRVHGAKPAKEKKDKDKHSKKKASRRSSSSSAN